ncbi:MULTISPECIES: dethiobiotin synthase [unclassified Anaerobiospirillum]|uniref:dethiobiotin synthase n=1 Tax=unclassified Anaerobiospirillum TaxID=2647410 RepID=UPI001FF1CD08|nr:MULTISPECIES: dethiobiotin synthase [unclassified Anaerobiospirillum]MCK0526576.1 dethiobiotin synthase [Anaerobiospirillum sp. NML120449]MCK0534763.1 dethiobiotin synthase [Anaerobiospirillum sp. NML120511]MCK0539465.1 dethiobiotin synthase [Anaerobiospirillum sp. NML02-A-032]
MKSVILLGAEPKVGKTYIASLLIQALKRSGQNPGYFKFAQAGISSIEMSDAAAIQNKCNVGQELSEMLPYVYSENLPVHLAARESGNFINPRVIQERFGWNVATHPVMVVEGTGEVICPLIMEDNQVLMQEDLISRLKLNTVVVLRMSSSSLNQASLAVYYLRNIGFAPQGIIVNGFDESNYAHCDACNLIERFTQTRIIATVGKNQRSLNLRCNLNEIFNPRALHGQTV